MTALTGTSHVGFTVKSLARSEAFYVDLLGFEVVHRWRADAPYIGDIVGYPGVTLDVCTVALPGTELGLELLEYCGVPRGATDTGNANPGTAHLAFVVDDLLAVYERWTATGVAAIGRPLRHSTGPNTGGWVVYLIDPDGFRLELIQRPPG